MRIPGPERQEDGGLSAVAAAGGLHRYQLRLHEAYGPVVRFQLPGADTAVSVADPVLLEGTAHIDTRPEALFAFLDPLCEAGNLQVLPADEHTPGADCCSRCSPDGRLTSGTSRASPSWRGSSRTAGRVRPTANPSSCNMS